RQGRRRQNRVARRSRARGAGGQRVLLLRSFDRTLRGRRAGRDHRSLYVRSARPECGLPYPVVYAEASHRALLPGRREPRARGHDDRHLLLESPVVLPRDVAAVRRRMGRVVAMRPRGGAALAATAAAELPRGPADRTHRLRCPDEERAMIRLGTALAALACTLASGGLMAHHSTRSLYHQDREVELVGKVVEWRFINPHPFLIIEAEAEDGIVREWDVSYGGAAVVHLKRQGYTAD